MDSIPLATSTPRVQSPCRENAEMAKRGGRQTPQDTMEDPAMQAVFSAVLGKVGVMINACCDAIEARIRPDKSFRSPLGGKTGGEGRSPYPLPPDPPQTAAAITAVADTGGGGGKGKQGKKKEKEGQGGSIERQWSRQG